jgi:hypothetical protein
MKTGQLVGMFLKNRIFSLQTSMASIINLKKGILSNLKSDLLLICKKLSTSG